MFLRRHHTNTQNIKIIHLASGDLWAGAEVQLFHLAKKLVQFDKIQLLVVLLNHGQLEEELKANGVDVLVLDENAMSGFLISKALIKVVKKFQPDIIHTHRQKENVIGGFVAKLLGVKSVRTVHGASEFGIGIYDLKRLIFTGLDFVAGYFLQKVIIAVSDELKDKLSGIFPVAKVKVINNSIDLNYLRAKAAMPSSIQLDRKYFNVVFVGRFVPVKRVDLFYEIAKKTIKVKPDNAIHFHMLGDGPMKSAIEQQIKLDGLQDRIHLHGFVENSAPAMAKMNLLMFTSDHEGLPMTLLEAMALKVPVLTRNLPTIRSVLCDGKCGYVIDSDNVDEFVTSIIDIEQHEADVKVRVERASEVIAEEYELDKTVGSYISMYQSIIS